jgi:hypothetical protein
MTSNDDGAAANETRAESPEPVPHVPAVTSVQVEAAPSTGSAMTSTGANHNVNNFTLGPGETLYDPAEPTEDPTNSTSIGDTQGDDVLPPLLRALAVDASIPK